MHRFAKPSVFLNFTAPILPWLSALTVILIAAGLYFSLIGSPVDYQQGHTVRIMYIHVPTAWMGLFCYVGMAICGAMSLIWKHPLADICARATAPGWCNLYRPLPDYRIALGGTDVGHLVGVGCPSDIDADLVVPLSRLYGTGECL